MLGGTTVVIDSVGTIRLGLLGMTHDDDDRIRLRHTDPRVSSSSANSERVRVIDERVTRHGARIPREHCLLHPDEPASDHQAGKGVDVGPFGGSQPLGDQRVTDFADQVDDALVAATGRAHQCGVRRAIALHQAHEAVDQGAYALVGGGGVHSDDRAEQVLPADWTTAA